jgi:hypothetical protein
MLTLSAAAASPATGNAVHTVQNINSVRIRRYTRAPPDRLCSPCDVFPTEPRLHCGIMRRQRRFSNIGRQIYLARYTCKECKTALLDFVFVRPASSSAQGCSDFAAKDNTLTEHDVLASRSGRSAATASPQRIPSNSRTSRALSSTTGTFEPYTVQRGTLRDSGGAAIPRSSEPSI